MKKISIIIPFLNEEGNLTILFNEIRAVMKGRDYEIICINDGSTDGSVREVQSLGKSDDITMLSHLTPQGKGTALAKGIQKAKGSYIVFMDADLQDDPADLPAFIEKLDEGYDLVNGWRHNRKDKAHMKTISSIGNKIIWKGLLNTSLRDMNCGFKAFQRHVLKDIVFYGDNYRFMAYLAEQKGYKVAEVRVNNRNRKFGTSKYNAIKVFFGFIDTLTTYFIIRYSQKPFHFFGALGSLIFGVGAIIGAILTYEWYFYGEVLSRRPLLLFSMLLIIIGVQFFLTGIVSELIVYLQHRNEHTEKQAKHE